MSSENLLKQDLLVAPADSDEQFIIRLEYEDPIRKASIWLHKLIIHRLRDVQLAAPWYRGETDEPPEQLVSDLFSQADGRFCRRFDYFCRMVKKYRQGEVPQSVIEDDHRAVTILIAALSDLAENTETLRLFTRRVREFVLCITAREGGRLLRNDYIRRIDELAESIITISGRVSDEFLRIEKTRRGEISEPATKAEVKTAVESIVAALAKSHPAKQQRKRQADWRKDDPAVLKRRDDTKRVLAEIRKRHKATSVSYVKIIDSMRRDPVWGARMRHMNAESWRAKAISR